MSLIHSKLRTTLLLITRNRKVPSTLSAVTWTRMGSTSGVIDYTAFLNDKAKRRYPSLIREMTKKLATAEPGTIFMAGGLPNPSLFPFQALQVKLESGSELTLGAEQLQAALQYQPTTGYPPLHSELLNFVNHFHKPPRLSDESALIVTVGSQNALHAILEMIVEEGDPVLIPAPMYSASFVIMDPHKVKYLPVQEDKDGMIPEQLDSVLSRCKSSGEKMPKILYVNPTGTNPSGAVLPEERKRKIYEICCKYNILILEDDPYYFLHFLESDPPSFLSLDVEGRVLRLDSFSKILSSGLRVGFATGPKELIRVLELSLQASILHASSLSQVLVHGVLKEWGISGFIAHTNRVKAFYKRRRDLMVAAAEKHLKGLAEWNSPQGGMFLWLKIPGVPDTYGMVMEKGAREKVMLLPGREFFPDRSQPSAFLRAAYSVIPENQMDEGMARLAKLIREEMKSQKNKP